jgi:D-3-phosphoglycerate dehydrogenase
MRVLYIGPRDTLEYVRENLPSDFETLFAGDDTEVDRVVENCDVIFDASMKVRFPEDRLERAHQLKLFITATTGSDHIDASVLRRREIPLLTLRGQSEILRNLTPAAEHSWLLLMACARHFRSAVEDVLKEHWDRNRFPGILLKGKTLGIIGCGRIGQWMSRYASAFGMTCLGYDPDVTPWPDPIQKSDLESLLRRSNFITIHVPLTEKTRRLLGPEEFGLIKEGAVLVNTSRGEVIDESSLLTALLEGRLAAAGLDVLTGEPRVADHPLIEYARRHANLLITPHIGGYSPEALKYVLSFSCRRIREFFGSEP